MTNLSRREQVNLPWLRDVAGLLLALTGLGMFLAGLGLAYAQSVLTGGLLIGGLLAVAVASRLGRYDPERQPARQEAAPPPPPG